MMRGPHYCDTMLNVSYSVTCHYRDNSLQSIYHMTRRMEEDVELNKHRMHLLVSQVRHSIILDVLQVLLIIHYWILYYTKKLYECFFSFFI